MRAMVVDDATTVRSFHRSILERVGFAVEEAVNGIEALERALGGTAPPDLMVVDVNMPLMDGYTFLRAARAEPLLRAVPSIIVSTERAEADAAAAYGAGANLFLVKPVDPALLSHLAAGLTGLPRRGCP